MDDSLTLKAHLERFADLRLVCLGDVMLDRYVNGAVRRISQEAPIPVLLKGDGTAMIGGAGNVARNLAAMGAKVDFISLVGTDAAGLEIEALTQATEGIHAHFLRDDSRPTTLKTRYVAAGQQLLRVDEESDRPLDPAQADELLDMFADALARADAVILSDYAKGLFSGEVLGRAIALARAAGKPIIADPKRQDLSAYNGVTLLKPNRAELAAATGLPCIDDDQIEAAAAQVLAQTEIGMLLVSKSERGLSLLRRDGPAIHLSPRAHQVFDVSGAGDTVVAAVALSLAAGASAEDAAYLANEAGGIVVQKYGTAVVTAGELADAVTRIDLADPEAKVMNREQAAARVGRWRAAGLKIGFTNGCFDILHPGHLSLIREAASQCERLIVAIDDDASVRRLKGEDRPVQSEAARAVMLAALNGVDMVVPFSEGTLISLLELLRPDLLIKGGDYGLDEVVGAEQVRAYGGEIRVARLVPRQSSSRLIERMTQATGDKDG